MFSCKDEVLAIAKQLVQVKSVVNTEGEKDAAQFIYNWISSLSYYQTNPSSVEIEKTVDDEQDRYNVIALVKGNKSSSNQTVILMGHIDTVDTDDFGQLKNAACDPDHLIEGFRNEKNLPPLVRDHAESGDWVFGRGVLDMKSGVASNLYLLKYFSEHPEELEGNLVLIAECDEEDGSRGMLSSLKTLKKWKTEHQLDYIAAINADFVSPRYEGDENRYIYKGTVGKLLPSFFITGAETHVGSSFEGLDPNYLAAYLTKQISYNPELCDKALGEVTVPPVSLKQTDLKPAYTVQTALSSYVYYNFFVHSWSPKEVLEKLKDQAMIAFSEALADLQDRYRQFAVINKEQGEFLPWKARVLLYEEMNQMLSDTHGDHYSKHMEQFKENLLLDQSLDTRMYAAKVVEEAWKWMEDKSPAMILFYSSLYSPRIEMTGENESEQNLMHALDTAVEKVQPHYPYPIVTRNFFPFISDMSFVSLSDDEAGIEAVIHNNPGWGSKHYVEFEDIRDINVPVINIGPYGYDAHKKYERTEIQFTFEIVPNLTFNVIKSLIGRRGDSDFLVSQLIFHNLHIEKA